MIHPEQKTRCETLKVNAIAHTDLASWHPGSNVSGEE